MKVCIPKEIREGEKRVALVPDVISKLTKLGYEVVIESGAGVDSQAPDDLAQPVRRSRGTPRQLKRRPIASRLQA